MTKQFSTLIGSSLIAMGVMAAIAGNASAASLIPGTVLCATSNVTGTTDCEGAFEGNNSNQDLDGLFDKLWEKDNPHASGEIKVDGTSGTTEDGFLTISSADSEALSGTWSLSQSFIDTYDHAMFVVKGGDSFSAYLWNGLETSGTWNTLGVEKGNGEPGPGLSHFSVYGIKGDDDDNESVPEPAAMAGLMAIGAGIVINRRKQAK